MESVSEVADYLNLDRALVAKVMEFLLKKQLIAKSKQGFSLGPRVTHLEHDSPFVMRHRMNWRIQGLKSMENQRSNDLFYSGLMALSEDSAQKIRKELVSLIENATKGAAKSDSEILRCLNIDWFGIGAEVISENAKNRS